MIPNFPDGTRVTMTSAIIRFDRTRCGNAAGQTVEVFDPPWWRLDRWFTWWFLSRGHSKGYVTMTVNGISRSLRTRGPRNVIRPVYIREE
jgi:hypothetical protein